MKDPTTAKLTVDQVRQIRRELADDVPQSDLAREYGVTRSCINDIARRKSWKWI